MVLEVLSQDPRLAMSLFFQDESGHTVRYYHQRLVDPRQMESLSREVTGILYKSYLVGPRQEHIQNSLKKVGQMMWDHFLARQVKEELLAQSGGELSLVIDESLVRVPWELMYDGQDFLCVKFSVGRLVRASRQAEAIRYRQMHTSARMLVIANPTGGLPAAYQEGVCIRDQLDGKRRDISVDLRAEEADSLYLKKNLRDYDIVHFAGHCEYDTTQPHRAGWALKDGLLNFQDVLMMGEGRTAMPSIVFSNACQSAQVMETGPAAFDQQHRTYSFASSFLFAGVRHYIGTVGKVDDRASLSFALAFYKALAKGKATGECVRQARISLMREYGTANLAWAQYLMYGDPGHVLIKKLPPKKKLARHLSAPPGWMKKAGVAAAAAAVFVAVAGSVLALRPQERILLVRAKTYLSQGNNQEAVAAAEMITARRAGALAAYPVLFEGYVRLGKKEKARQALMAYALLSEKHRAYENLADAYISLGWFHYLGGEYEKAMAFYEKALSVSRQQQDLLHEAVALRRMAVWHIDKGDNGRALELLSRSVEIHSRFANDPEHQYHMACAYFDMGLVFINKNEFEVARQFYRKSAEGFQKLKRDNELSDYYFNLGEIFLFEKQYQKAKEHYAEGLRIDLLHDNRANLPSDYVMIGELSFEMGDLVEAERHFQLAVQAGKRIDSPADLAQAYHGLGRIYAKKNHISKAREHLRLAQELYYSLGFPEYQQIKEEYAGLSSAGRP